MTNPKFPCKFIRYIVEPGFNCHNGLFFSLLLAEWAKHTSTLCAIIHFGWLMVKMPHNKIAPAVIGRTPFQSKVKYRKIRLI